MGLHDSYGQDFASTQEYTDYLNGKLKDPKAYYEHFMLKYKIDFKIDKANADKVLDLLPESYKPNTARLEQQKAISERLHDVIFKTAYEINFNPMHRVAGYSSTKSGARYLNAIYMHIAFFGTPEHKEKVTTYCTQVFEKKMALDKALNTPENAEAIDIARDELYEAQETLDNFGKEVLAEELERAANDVPHVMELMEQADNPEKLLEHYNEIRKYNNFYSECDNFLPHIKDQLQPGLYEKYKLLFGSVMSRQMELLNRASYLANPEIAERIDMENIKTLENDPEVYEKFSEAGEWELFDTRNKKGIEGKHIDTEYRNILGVSAHINFVRSEWEAEINDCYGVRNSSVEILTLNGERKELNNETLVELYEKGEPFYAIPKDCDSDIAQLCVPTANHHLVAGFEAIKNLDTKELEFKGHVPSKAARAWDAFISIFSKDLRVKEVVKYEQELAEHNKHNELRKQAKLAKAMVENPGTSLKSQIFGAKVRREVNQAKRDYESAEVKSMAERLKISEVEARKRMGEKAQAAAAESERSARITDKSLAEEDSRRAHIKAARALGLPRNMVYRFRVALENGGKASLEAMNNPAKDWVKSAARMVVANLVLGQVEDVISGKITDTKQFPGLLKNICKDSNAVANMNAIAKGLENNAEFANYLSSLSDEKKMDIFGNGLGAEQRAKISEFNNTFLKSTMGLVAPNEIANENAVEQNANDINIEPIV